MNGATAQVAQNFNQQEAGSMTDSFVSSSDMRFKVVIDRSMTKAG